MSLAISGTSIRQDSNGRFCLNDLHKASGGEKRHQPANWLRTEQVVDLIGFLESEESKADFSVIESKQGLGTFVVKELVYSYAMWISAKFQITVIRAYDSLVSKPAYALRDLPPQTLTPAMLRHIEKRISWLNKNQVGSTYAGLGRMIKEKFNVNERKAIHVSKYPEICALLGCEPDPKALQGELLEPAKIATPEFNPTSPTFTLENITNQTVITQQHNGLTVSYIAEKGTLIGTVENIIRDLKVLGYHVVKNEKDALETISRIANSGFVA
jgi:hypothetical protein